MKFGSILEIYILNALEHDVIIEDDLCWISFESTNFPDSYLDVKITSIYLDKREVARARINIAEMKQTNSDWLTNPKDLSLISNFAKPLSLHSRISEITETSTKIEITRSLEGTS